MGCDAKVGPRDGQTGGKKSDACGLGRGILTGLVKTLAEPQGVSQRQYIWFSLPLIRLADIFKLYRRNRRARWCACAPGKSLDAPPRDGYVYNYLTIDKMFKI